MDMLEINNGIFAKIASCNFYQNLGNRPFKKLFGRNMSGKDRRQSSWQNIIRRV
ncbi:MAG: hypothetical protein WC178_02670 [Candidatus Paceibacterota bacterium]